MTTPRRSHTGRMPIVAEHHDHADDEDHDDEASETVASSTNASKSSMKKTNSLPIDDTANDMNDDDYGAMADISRGVRVIVRVRPTLGHETGESTSLLRVSDDNETSASGTAAADGLQTISLRCMGSGNGGGEADHRFAFDGVLPSLTGQAGVYEAGQIDHMLHAVLRGYHATIFAYGQTGSGKTFTMVSAAITTARHTMHANQPYV